MFNTPGFMTSGYASDVPLMTQMILTNLINKTNESQKEMDYLQVFRLRKTYSNGKALQEITHSQELPSYCQTIYLQIPVEDIITTKIFVIDDNDHHTYLLASEY